MSAPNPDDDMLPSVRSYVGHDGTYLHVDDIDTFLQAIIEYSESDRSKYGVLHVPGLRTAAALLFELGYNGVSVRGD